MRELLPARQSRFAPIPAEIEIALPVIWQFDDKAAECLLVAHHRLAGRIEFAGELHHDRLDERIERRCSRERDRGRKRTYQRSEEHTSELQSLMRISYAVLCLKKKNYINLTQ